MNRKCSNCKNSVVRAMEYKEKYLGSEITCSKLDAGFFGFQRVKDSAAETCDMYDPQEQEEA